MAWKNIPEKKVLATLKDGKEFKGTASEKMTIYVDGAVPGGEGDVQGISMTVDPSTYVMTTQLKDGKGGNVGSPATIDLPLESMVVGGEYDDNTKSVILTLKNGQTVTFSVADLVAGLQTEITSENPLSADLVAETSNKNFVTEQEKEDIGDIQNIKDSVGDLSSLDTTDKSSLVNAINEVVEGGSGGGGVLTLFMLDPFSTSSPEVGDHLEFCRDKELTDPITATELDAALNEGKAVQINCLYNAGDDWGPYYVTVTDFYDDGSYGSYMSFTIRSSNVDAGYRVQFCGDNDYATVIARQSYDIQADWNEIYDSSSAFIKNKPTIPSKVSDLTNDAGYQNASQVSSAIASAVGDITSFEYQVVQTLPASGAKGIIYLVPTEESGEPQNIYEEYIWVIDEEESGDTGRFELIGTTEIDLSNYVTNSDLHDYTASVAFTSENSIEITDDDNNSIGFTIETDAETGSQNLAVTGPDGSFNVPNAEDVTNALAGKVDAIDPTYLPSGAEQGGIIYVTDHTDIDPDSIADGQMVFDQNDHILYIAEVTVDSETGENIVTWHEVQTEKEVIYVNVTVTDVQTMTFTVSGYTANDICALLDAGVNVIYRLNLAQPLPGLSAGVYDFRPIMHASSGGYGGVMSSMIGPSGNNTILGIASHVDSGTSHFEMRQLANASDIPEDMVILDYGTSTWSDFLAAYNDNRIVYCRASSGTDPSVGSKTRLAFMAYVNNETSPTEVEFQYLRSVSNKSASNQCDQVFVYKLTSANGGTWTVETRNTMVKIAAGTNITSAYSGGTLTLSADLSSKQDVIDSTHKLSADLIDNSNSTNKTYETGTGAPTSSTTGSVGELYVDSNTGKVYVCTDDTGGTYTWEEAGGTSAQTGSTAPSTSTVGEIGQIYVNTTDGKSYICTDTTGGTYTWTELIPTVNNATLTIQKNGTTVQTFSANASSNKTVNFDIPTITMQTTDPGEGVALAANHFIAVYEA